jgi:hypothetical protein
MADRFQDINNLRLRVSSLGPMKDRFQDINNLRLRVSEHLGQVVSPRASDSSSHSNNQSSSKPALVVSRDLALRSDKVLLVNPQERLLEDRLRNS